jgi:hypothetical protein
MIVTASRLPEASDAPRTHVLGARSLKLLGAAYFARQPMSTDGLRHLAHGEHSDIDGVEPAQKARKLRGPATASGRNALEARIS